MPSGDPEKDRNLPGMGGVFNSGNLAGYTYTHQNPVRYVDPDGNEITISRHVNKTNNVKSVHYSAKFSVYLTNNSSKSLNQSQMKVIASRIKNSIESTFTGKDGNVSWSTDVQVNLKKQSRDHEFQLVDSSAFSSIDTLGEANKIGGNTALLNVDQLISGSKGSSSNGSLERTSSHEFGHLFGLLHPSGKGQNLMTQTRFSTSMNVIKSQITNAYMKFKFRQINKGL